MLEKAAREQRLGSTIDSMRSTMATAADGDGDGIVFEMGSNKRNDAAIADDVRHGRTAPF